MAASSLPRSASKSDRRTVTVVCSAPNWRASASACGTSSLAVPAYSAKPRVSVRSCAPVPAVSEASIAESSPAERNTPTGTSETRCAVTLPCRAAAEMFEGVFLGARGRLGRRLRQDVGDEAIRPGRLRAALADPHGVARRHAADAAVQGPRVGHAAPEKKAGMAGRLGAGVDRRSQQRLHLRGHAQGVAVVGVVQRLDAEGVARQQHRALAPVPEREGEHAAQLVQHGRAVLS